MIAFGDDVIAIHGSWKKGTNPSINIDEVNRLTGQGMSLEDAVQNAWTVTRAKKIGFLNVRVIHQEGLPGNFRKIDVMIEK